MSRGAKKANRPTTVWDTHEARTNVTDVEHAATLDRRQIDSTPSLAFLWLAVVVPLPTRPIEIMAQKRLWFILIPLIAP